MPGQNTPIGVVLSSGDLLKSNLSFIPRNALKKETIKRQFIHLVTVLQLYIPVAFIIFSKLRMNLNQSETQHTRHVLLKCITYCFIERSKVVSVSYFREKEKRVFINVT